MSLTVYLEDQNITIRECTCDCGHKHERREKERLYRGNITHNLCKMADLAGLYGYLWRPDENDVVTALDLVPHLNKGLDELLGSPEKFISLNPENDWGSYDYLVKFVEEYLAACLEHPQSIITVCR